MSFTVESGLAIPPSKKRATKYPFAKMSIGDSFSVPIDENDDIKCQRGSISGSYSAWGRRHGQRFVSRLMTDEKCIRVWRVE